MTTIKHFVVGRPTTKNRFQVSGSTQSKYQSGARNVGLDSRRMLQKAYPPRLHHGRRLLQTEYFLARGSA